MWRSWDFETESARQRWPPLLAAGVELAAAAAEVEEGDALQHWNHPLAGASSRALYSPSSVMMWL